MLRDASGNTPRMLKILYDLAGHYREKYLFCNLYNIMKQYWMYSFFFFLASVHHALNLGTDALMGTQVIKNNANFVYTIGEKIAGHL